MKIGNIECENNLILGPMAGVTDLPFRLLCKEQGCGLLYTEMISAKAIMYHNKNTIELMRIDEKEHPVALQLFGNDPEIMADMASIVENGSCDIIDVNMGCPVPKVVNNGEGSALLKNPNLVESILNRMVKAVKKPVTVKIRIGMDENSINAVEVAKAAEQAGVSAIAVHGRTREQYYSGRANWNVIRQVKESVSIPIIGNGDIASPQDARRMLNETGCDGIMIGRAARGNPWIFSQIDHYLKTGEQLLKPTRLEIKTMILRHGKLQLKFKGELIGMKEMRKHVAWYTAGLSHSAALRNYVNQIETYEQLEELVNDKI